MASRSPSASIPAQWFKRYGFLMALLTIGLVTLADRPGVLTGAGRWLKTHHAPDLVVLSIFFFSGLSLSPKQLKEGLLDVGGILAAFAVIFIAAPLVAVLICRFPLSTGIVIGLFLVAVMPSTLSSGVVMTAAAGGSAAHALITTIAANTLSVVTIPHVLSLLLASIGQSATATIDRAAIMLKIAFIVVLPLLAGMLARHFLTPLYRRFERHIGRLNQSLILVVVWVAMSQTRDMLVHSGPTVGLIIVLVAVYHGLLLWVAWGIVRLSGRGPGRRESLLFMGTQKTLPLSIILQMSLFPQYGIALLVCVLHHIIHLMIDAYLVGRLRNG